MTAIYFAFDLALHCALRVIWDTDTLIVSSRTKQHTQKSYNKRSNNNQYAVFFSPSRYDARKYFGARKYQQSQNGKYCSQLARKLFFSLRFTHLIWMMRVFALRFFFRACPLDMTYI